MSISEQSIIDLEPCNVMRKRPIVGPDSEAIDLSAMVAGPAHHRVKSDAFTVREIEGKPHVPSKESGRGSRKGPRRSKQLVGPLQWP